jgi:hypothetical protein
LRGSGRAPFRVSGGTTAGEQQVTEVIDWFLEKLGVSFATVTITATDGHASRIRIEEAFTPSELVSRVRARGAA